MTDPALPTPEHGSKDAMYQPSAEGGPEAAPERAIDYRDSLRSRRWDAAPLENPEAEKTDPRLAVVALLVLAAITLVVLVIGYGSGFWSMPA